MKNFKWIAAVVVFLAFAKANSLQAQQDFKAIAHYIAQSKFDVKEDSTDAKEVAEDPRRAEITAQIKAALAAGSKQEYTMKFTPTESSYEKVIELAKPKKPSGGISVSFQVNNGSTNTVYKDLKEGKFYREDQIMGKEFLIIDDVKTYDWQLTQESKKIGNYTCYKATYTPEITEEEQTEKEKKEKDAKEGSLFALIPEEDKTITAWWTPEIPISNGPGEYQGLPGMILEVKEANTILLCTKIEINPEEDLNIKQPKSGKEINEKDFDELRDKKMEERMKKNGGKGFFITETRSN
ncbi:GLPGLI family protein [Nonlabens sp. Hel1_33_55]|uniref:GLPGLI family protein n=1 Tax=Nonlabens sp. Hel1_33_55 TaxID=1336802 RepID=UPI000875C934|nr:GLPGLI family protein [Nonlabens sp. Hel1_33_55]SCY27163.1 GLPGLI family protein [Nonlabens sp. Hel1_33_55]